ncbi:LacI family DNA-binding transcriptional regulator [Nonomuraea roseoviolacea subsp. roseoviolacea]|uniref:LacI family DNA-binding transcriptional regulator n=1 Tax=Nonomuraea roseoviolacea TaxID=103837 RepID=UPI0031D1A915
MGHHKKGQSVSISDVARVAGVAKSTVSRAFIHPTLVAAPTRERIRRIADEMGFRPSRVARALSTGRTGLVGLVVPTLSNPFFGPLVAAMQQAAEEEDRQIVLMISELSAERETRIVERLSREVDGLIVATSLCEEAFLRKVAKEIPLVLVDRKVGRLASVLIDTPSGVAAIADHLIGMGHRRLCYVSGPPGSWADAPRIAALRTRAEQSGAEIVVAGPIPPTVDAGIEIAETVAAAGVTAVIGYNSATVLGLLHGLGTRGVRVPEDVSVASADDFILLQSTKPAVTVLHLPLEEAGQAAVRMLERLLRGERPGRPVVIGPRLVIRESTLRARSPGQQAGQS